MLSPTIANVNLKYYVKEATARYNSRRPQVISNVCEQVQQAFVPHLLCLWLKRWQGYAPACMSYHPPVKFHEKHTASWRIAQKSLVKKKYLLTQHMTWKTYFTGILYLPKAEKKK